MCEIQGTFYHEITLEITLYFTNSNLISKLLNLCIKSLHINLQQNELWTFKICIRREYFGSSTWLIQQLKYIKNFQKKKTTINTSHHPSTTISLFVLIDLPRERLITLGWYYCNFIVDLKAMCNKCIVLNKVYCFFILFEFWFILVELC